MLDRGHVASILLEHQQLAIREPAVCRTVFPDSTGLAHVLHVMTGDTPISPSSSGSDTVERAMTVANHIESMEFPEQSSQEQVSPDSNGLEGRTVPASQPPELSAPSSGKPYSHQRTDL